MSTLGVIMTLADNLRIRLHRCWLMGSLFSLCTLVVGTVKAIPLAPGESAQGLDLRGVDSSTALLEIESVGFSNPEGYNGKLLSAVSSTQVEPAVGLTFTYQILHLGPDSAVPIQRVELSGFAGLDVDVGYYFGGVAPAAVYRDASGDKIGYEFFQLVENPATDSLSPDTTSAVLLIQTSASQYVLREYAASFDSGLAIVPTLAPASELDLVHGDTNGDQVVDIADLNNVRNNFGGSGLGDTNGDGAINIVDLNNVRNFFGMTAPQSVPEPSALVLLTITFVGAVARLRRS